MVAEVEERPLEDLSVTDDPDRAGLLHDEDAVVSGGRGHEDGPLERADLRQDRGCRDLGRGGLRRRRRGHRRHHDERSSEPLRDTVPDGEAEWVRPAPREANGERLSLPLRKHARAATLDRESLRRSALVAHDEPDRRAGRRRATADRERRVLCDDAHGERRLATGSCGASEYGGDASTHEGKCKPATGSATRHAERLVPTPAGSGKAYRAFRRQ